MIKIANHAHYYKAHAKQLVQNLKQLQVDHEYQIQIDDCQITLCSELNKQKTCFTHSFLDAQLHRRALQRNQALLKACHNKKNTIHHIVDLTAGWGKDSFLLAYQGRQVTMLEHNALIYHCLNYLLQSAREESNDKVFQNLSIQLTDSYEYLQQEHNETVDCYYIDPMFPPHKSSARPGKDLQLLQQITINQSIEQVFRLALQQHVQRVVVKRPLHAPNLDELKPDICYREKTIRFDVYLRQASA